MDFTPTETAAEAGALAGDIASSVSTAGRVAELETAHAPLDVRLWRALGEAGLLGLGADEALGSEETVAAATALGRSLGRVPYGPHAVAALPAIAEFGSPELIELLAGGAADGPGVLGAAFEVDLGVSVTAPSTRLTDGRLTGAKVNVPYAEAADHLLVNAIGPDGATVAVVATDTHGVTVIETPSTGLTPVYTVEFDDVEVDAAHVLRGGASTVVRVADFLRLAVAADQAGVVTAALEATAEYAREREQFGRAIGSFQAVAQRLADGYIDAQGLALTVAQAAWLLSPDSGASPAEISAAVATAKFWADEAGHRVAHTTVHVHGGVGLDTSHPAHRYFLRAKQNEFTLGTAPVLLDELGKLLPSDAIEAFQS